MCKHPQCKGCRATTEHIFWECKAYDKIRAKFLSYIDSKLLAVRKVDRAGHNELKRILSNNCFRNCAICPDNKDQLKVTYELDPTDPFNSNIRDSDIYRDTEEECLDQTRGDETTVRSPDFMRSGEVTNSLDLNAPPTHVEPIATNKNGYNSIYFNNVKHCKVYTDGSALHATSRELARAGWGVYYCEDSKHNIASKLHGPVQTSYRAEVRALLHVFQTAGDPVCAFVDCQGVVNTINNYTDGKYTNIDKLQESDLCKSLTLPIPCLKVISRYNGCPAT